MSQNQWGKLVLILLTVSPNCLLKSAAPPQPELFEIAQENYTIKEQSEKLKRKQAGESFKEGPCEECAKYDILYSQDERLICESCRDSM